MTKEAQRLYDALRLTPSRKVYRVHGNRGWFLSNRGGQYSEASVRELVEAGLVSSVYSDCLDDGYYVGKTIDVARTVTSRKKLGKDTPLIYV